jgi:hypothetical protein
VLRGGVIAERLPDGADPVQAFGIGRIGRKRRLEMPDRLIRLLQFEADFSEFVMQRPVARTLAEELEQQRLGDQMLPGRHQRLDQIGTGRPMAGVEFQRLEIERDRILRPARLEVDIAEIAPASGETGDQPQRRLVVVGCGEKVAGDHQRIGEIGVQVGENLDRDAAVRLLSRDGETAPVGRRRLGRPARNKVLAPKTDTTRQALTGLEVRRGGVRICGHGSARLPAMSGRRVAGFGKQILAAPSSAAARGKDLLSCAGGAISGVEIPGKSRAAMSGGAPTYGAAISTRLGGVARELDRHVGRGTDHPRTSVGGLGLAAQGLQQQDEFFREHWRGPLST